MGIGKLFKTSVSKGKAGIARSAEVGTQTLADAGAGKGSCVRARAGTGAAAGAGAAIKVGSGIGKEDRSRGSD